MSKEFGNPSDKQPPIDFTHVNTEQTGELTEPSAFGQIQELADQPRTRRPGRDEQRLYLNAIEEVVTAEPARNFTGPPYTDAHTFVDQARTYIKNTTVGIPLYGNLQPEDIAVVQEEYAQVVERVGDYTSQHTSEISEAVETEPGQNPEGVQGTRNIIGKNVQANTLWPRIATIRERDRTATHVVAAADFDTKRPRTEAYGDDPALELSRLHRLQAALEKLPHKLPLPDFFRLSEGEQQAVIEEIGGRAVDFAGVVAEHTPDLLRGYTPDAAPVLIREADELRSLLETYKHVPPEIVIGNFAYMYTQGIDQRGIPAVDAAILREYCHGDERTVNAHIVNMKEMQDLAAMPGTNPEVASLAIGETHRMQGLRLNHIDEQLERTFRLIGRGLCIDMPDLRGPKFWRPLGERPNGLLKMFGLKRAGSAQIDMTRQPVDEEYLDMWESTRDLSPADQEKVRRYELALSRQGGPTAHLDVSVVRQTAKPEAKNRSTMLHLHIRQQSDVVKAREALLQKRHESIERARQIEGENVQKPFSGGLPGTKRRGGGN
jgi:hypothetical protein